MPWWFFLQTLLEGAQPRLFEDLLAPLRKRLEQLLNHPRWGGDQLRRRIRILDHRSRQPNPEVFERAATALVERRCLDVSYDARGSGVESIRRLSPQRLVHYRDNWYLDAWCHRREALRTFSLDRVRRAHVLADPAIDFSDEELDALLTRGYGIFGGQVSAIAILRFSAEQARWVSEENWFPGLTGWFLTDGRHELQIPYSDPRELVMDVLRYGPDVEVVGPEDLRAEVAKRLRAALEQYEGKKSEQSSWC